MKRGRKERHQPVSSALKVSKLGSVKTGANSWASISASGAPKLKATRVPTLSEPDYLVVDRGRFFQKRCLIPMPAARIDAQHHALSIDIDDADSQAWEQFDPVTFPRFSDDDLITAMFAPHA